MEGYYASERFCDREDDGYACLLLYDVISCNETRLIGVVCTLLLATIETVPSTRWPLESRLHGRIGADNGEHRISGRSCPLARSLHLTTHHDEAQMDVTH